MKRKSSAINLQYIRLFIVPISFFVLPFLYSFHCNPKMKNQELKGVNGKDTTIIIGGSYLLFVPATFTVSLGKGDDSQLLQITNKDGSISAGYETGVDKIDQAVTFTFLQNNYDTVKKK